MQGKPLQEFGPMILPEEMKDIEFLRELGGQYLNQIAMMAQLKECEAETILFRQGESSPFIYIVLSGNVALRLEESAEKSVETSTVGPGELLGWSPVLGRPAMTATAQAATRCRLAVLDVNRIIALCESDPRFGVAFLRQIALVMSDRLLSARLNLVRALSNRP